MADQQPFSTARFRRAFGHFLVGKLAQAVALIAFTLVAARAMPSGEFAAYMLAMALIELGRPLTSLGLLPTIQQFLPDIAMHGRPCDLRRVLRVALAVRLAMVGLACSAAYAFWPGLLLWLDSSSSEGLPSAMIVTAFVGVTLLVDFDASVLEALLQQHVAQPLRSALAIGRLLILVSLLYVETDIRAHDLLVAELCLAVVCSLVGSALVMRAAHRFSPDSTRQLEWRRMLNFAWHVGVGQAIASAANPGAIRIVAVRVLPVEQFAYFAFLQQIVVYVTRFMPSMQFAAVVRPMLVANQVAGRSALVDSAIIFLWKVNLICGFAVVAAAFIGGDVLSRHLYGQAIEFGGIVLAMMLFVPVMVSQEHLSATWLQVRRLPSMISRLSVLALLVPVSVLFSGQIGELTGVATGLIFALALQSFATFGFAVRLSEMERVDLQGGLRVSCAALASVMGCLLLGRSLVDSHWLSGVTGAAVCLFVYAGLIRLLRPLSESDLLVMTRVSRRLGSCVGGFVRPQS
jgi:O-antigen/teichoic acid export membrane protein